MSDTPVAPGMSAASPSATAMADTPAPAARAEYPPLHYWRRWSHDAPTASASITPATGNGSCGPAFAVAAAQAASEAPYRVLVVEDDASQALFAASVLDGAGIQARVAGDREATLLAMGEFRPDLVLMDLHLPGTSGIELTAAIRADGESMHTPIVFMTGDTDPDLQIEVLENGADDFLPKPIKPRHLIAAVQSRIQRARALQRQRNDGSKPHPQTGLYARGNLLQRIANAIANPVGADARGGVLFVEIQNAAALHERYGYAGFEQLMLDAGRRLAELAANDPCARLNDNAFLVHVADPAQPLETIALRLRESLTRTAFATDDMPQYLAATIGFAALAHGFADAGNVLDAVEHAARAARTQPNRVSAWQPAAAIIDDHGALAETIRNGLHDGAFQLMFQPVVAVAGGDEAQFQVLLRLHDGEGALHSAGELVPVAEARGLMPEIDHWVLQQAIEMLHRRQAESRPVRLFVSQSPQTLARDLHGSWLLEMLSTHQVDGPSLVIDLRLADALVHSLTLRRFCEQLMPAGVQFCLSQYSHGDDADALLSQLPLGYLRLAARYSHANSDPRLRDELRLLIERAHRLGLAVIGPQVEDPQGAATLWMSGIDFIQGNLVEQALDAPDFDFQHSVL